MKTLEKQNDKSSTQQIVWFCFRCNRCVTVITCIQSKDYSSVWLFLLFTRFVQVRRRFPIRSGHSSRHVDDIRFKESWIMLFQSLQNERVRFTEQSNLLTAHVKRWKKWNLYLWWLKMKKIPAASTLFLFICLCCIKNIQWPITQVGASSLAFLLCQTFPFFALRSK